MVKYNDILQVRSFEDYISVPLIDIEQSIIALCLAKEGKSSVVCSPFYESEYLPYPIIISGRKLLFDSENSTYLVIGGKTQWEIVLKNVYCHGNLANHPLSKYYGFRDILNVKRNETVSKRKTSKTERWVLSGFFNSDLWENLKDVDLIIVDMVTTTPKLDKRNIEAILSYSKREKIPVVFFINASMDKHTEYLKSNGLKFLTSPIDLPKQTIFPIPTLHISAHHTRDEQLDMFLTAYNLRSLKINKNGLKKSIEIRKIIENDSLSDIHSKYSELIFSLKSRDYNKNGRNASFLAKMLYDSLMEFTGNVRINNTNSEFEWLTHPIGINRARFYDAIWNLSEFSNSIANKLIDQADSIMKNFESKMTPKGEYLSKLLLDYFSQDKTMVIIGKESAFSGFFRNTFQERSSLFEQFLVEPDQLEKAPISDVIIFLGQIYGRDKAKLLTSCSRNIIILNYPWQTSGTKKSIYEIKEFLSGEHFSSKGIDSGTNDKHFDLIEFSESFVIDHTKKNEEGVLNETRWKDLTTDLILNEFGDLFGDKMEQEPDEGLSYSDEVLEKNDSYGSNKWVVSIENRDIVIPDYRKIVLVKEKKTYMVRASKLNPGDRILITKDLNPKSMSEFVWEVMERRFGIKRKTHPSNEWREKLKRYVIDHPGITYGQILEKLKQMRDIEIETPAAIYLWLISYDVIGPNDLKTLEAIAKLVNSEDKLKEWWKGIQDIRMKHRRLIRHIWRVFTYNAKELKERNDENVVVDHTLGIKISDISQMVRFATVTGTPRKVKDGF